MSVGVAEFPRWETFSQVTISDCVLTWNEPHRVELALMFAFSCLAALGTYRVRQQMVRSPHREALFLAWTLLVILPIGVMFLMFTG